MVSLVDMLKNAQESDYRNNPDWIQGMALMSGGDPQRALNEHMETQSAVAARNAQMAEIQRKQQMAQAMPAAAQAIKDMPPEQAFDFLTKVGLPPEEAFAIIKQVDDVKNMGGLDETYIADPSGSGMVIAVDKKTGQGRYVDPNQVPAGAVMSEGMTPVMPQGMAQQGGIVAQPPAGLTPKSKQLWQEEQVKLGAGKAAKVEEAKVNLPKVISGIDEEIETAKSMLKHKGRSSAVGAKGPAYWLNPSNLNPLGDDGAKPISGTDAAGFESLYNQLKGKQFMSAYQDLKGGGSITEVETKAATQAKSAIDKATSEKDFIAATENYIKVLSDIKSSKAKEAGMELPDVNAGGGFKVIRRIK